MASSDKDASCANEPDFAVICSFLEKFSGQLQVEYPDFKQLQDWLTNTDEVPNGLRDLHVKLMRKTRRTVHECAWETALSKFCFSYSSQDGWEIERFGYKKSSLKVKLRIMRELLENQFDRNNKFRAQVLNMSAEWLRTEPIGRDRLGHSYWLTQDLDCNLRIYQEHLDEEIWQVVATNRDELVKLITRLKGNEVVLPSVIGDVDEDSSSNSCSAGLVKPPPPEEKDDSQESNQSTEGRIPNIKIKLGSKENGVVVNSDSPARVIDETPHENEAAPKEEKKVKPLVISQAKITMERSKKRSLDEADKVEPEEVKKHRPSLLDSKREKKLSKYEKAKQQDDEDEQNDDDGDEECDEEEEEDSADEGEEEEDVEEEAEGEEDADGEEDAEGEDDVNGEEDVDGEDEVDGEDDVDGNVELEEDDGEDFEEADDADDAEEDDDDDDDDEDDDVGEEIEDPPLIVSEDGSGKECDSGYNHFLAFAGLSDEPEFSEVIEETTLHVFGEGAGAECLVGNAKASEPEPKATFFFGQPGCLKLSPVKTQTKVEDGENHNDKKEEEDTKSTPEPANGENHTAEVEEKESETTKEEAPGKFAEIPEPNNDTQSPKPTTRPSIINRKRRLSEDKPEKHIRHSSESETDINSEVADDQLPESDEPEDIGGKRIKMRTKIMNADVRKKVEAQRQVAAVEETTSSSSEEERPRKKCSPKKIERDPEPPILPLKAKLKQAAVAARAMEQQEEEEKKCPSPKQPEEVEPEEAKVEVKKDDPDEKKPELEVVDEESPEQAVTTSPPPKGAVDVKEEPELANESHVSPAKHNKKSHTVESSEEADEEVPKKKQSPEPSPRPSPDKTDLKKTECEERTPEKLAPKSPEPAPDEHQSVVENQRKRRSSEDDSVAKQPTPPKSTVAPSVPVKTRTGRRGGPPEPVPELPQIKRTRLKPSERAAKPDVKKTTPTKAETAPKAKTPARAVPTKAAVKQEAPKEEPIDLKEEQPEPEQKEVKTEEVKEEEEVKTEDEPAATPTKTPPKSTVVQRPRQQAAQKQPATVHRRKTHDAVDAKNIIDVDEATPVRQSRRIAQLKIREEAERRKMEEIALRNMKAELKKKKKAEKAVDDPTVSEPSEHSSDHAESAGEVEVKKKAEKKKKCPGKGGWSSGSEEPEEEEEEQYETDPGSPLFRSDHEFSPESELEDESQVVPLKRARTARKEGEEVVPTAVTDESCQKCGKSDHPEWILLCDKCDKGYHCSCLSPVIFYIPEGDWFCPPCQQEELIAALENHLKDFDNLVQSKKEEEEERLRLEMQERLELEQAELEKLEKKTKRRQVRKKKGNAGGGRHRTYRRKMMSDDSADESDDNETETDASNSSRSNSTRGRSTRSQSESPTDSDDEPIYKLRKRRQINVSYRLNEYDDMIKSALKEEEDEVAGAGNLGRGKDISTIIEADKEEKLRQQQLRIAEENGEAVEEPEKTAANPAAPEDSGSDFEPLKRKPKGGRHLKKKSRKLTTLDISSEGDNDSDEDFKTSSMDDDDEDEEDDDDAQSSDSSLDVYRRRGRGGKNKKKTRRAARRSARERRKDRRFIVDDSDGSDDEERPRLKKKRKKDSDYTETETNDDDDDELSENIDSDDLCDDSTESEASDGAWRPSKRKKQRSSTIARKSPKLKPKSASRPKKTKRVDDNNRSFKSGISKNRAIRDDSDDDDDDADSVDSSRRTRGKRCTYLEDYEDESSDGGIKPGVKRPDTPPEEREQFIKKQEEIKRMLAEKNAEGAKLAATPRLIPIKAGAQRSPAKLDPLSTVPLSVIRQAKVLDIDYLQRKGESISEEDLEESEFDEDDLPDDFNPEDMDEEAIARMVEEEDFAQQQLKLPPPAEVLRKKPSKELDTVLKQVPSFMGPQPQQSTSSSSSGLQEPVRKKLPMPTMHPPLLRHGFGAPSQQMLQQHRSSAPPHLPLLQNALSAPQHNPMSRSFPPASQAIPATTAGMGPQPPGGSGSFAGGDPNKPRGRRKKITPLRDPLQKQQAAAAASAAAAAASKPRVDNMPAGKTEAKSPTIPVASPVVATPGVIKSALSIAQPPQLYKPPPANTQPSVITRMPHVQGRPIMPVNGPPYADQGPRFYRQPQPQPQPQQQQQQPPQPPGNVLIAGGRPPMRHRGPPMPPLPAHHSLRPSYVGGPPPLRPSSNAPPMSLPNDVRDQVQQRQSASYPGSDQQYTPPPARHSAPPHLSPYRPQMFGNPGFPQRGPPTNSSQPSAIRTAGAPPEYASPGSFVGVGGYNYYPPPLSVPHSAPPPPTASAVPSSVIVSASSLAAASSSASSAAAAAAAAASIPPQPPPTSAAAAPSRPPQPAPSPLTTDKPSVPATAPGVSTKAATPSVIELSRKKLTTLETFNTSKTVTPPPPLTESSESRSPYSSNPPTVGGVDDVPDDGSGSPPASSQTTSEFSGLVSYFSSQHDDLNT